MSEYNLIRIVDLVSCWLSIYGSLKFTLIQGYQIVYWIRL